MENKNQCKLSNKKQLKIVNNNDNLAIKTNVLNVAYLTKIEQI